MPNDTAYANRARATSAPRPDPCADACPPRCAACGGLECLCRPRFFPGQLLTDETLNLLSRYVVEKNKLHNRYLQGWGVACGLEVTCDPCDPKQVIVRTGYALAPCGDDIVVCNDQAVNICELIEQCRPQTQTVCDPPYARPPKDCRAGNNQWVLAICYDERPSRGLTALLGAADSACKSPCRCGGSAGCSSCGGSGCGGGASCGCGGKGAGPGSCTPSKPYNSKPRPTRQQNCEPTQICEGYRFIAYPAPKTTGPTPLPDFDRAGGSAGFMSRLLGWMFANRAHLGPLLERMLCCVGRAQELLADWGKGQKVDGLAAYEAYEQYAESMYAFASEFTLHRCAFVGRVGRLYDSSLEFRRSVANARELDVRQVEYVKGQLAQFDDALLEIVSECFCAALLPPCPEPAEGNCVPLAVVTLQANNCRVVDICNWKARKILVTWRTVGYWLSWLPWHCLRDVIANFCCGPRRGGAVMQVLSLILGVSVAGSFCGKVDRKPDIGAGAGAPGDVAAPGLGIGPAIRAAAVSTAPFGNLAQAAKSDDLLMHLLEEFDRGRSGEAAAPPWFKLAARLSDGSLLGDVAAIGGKGGLAEMQAQVQALTRSVESLQAQVDAQLHDRPHG